MLWHELTNEPHGILVIFNGDEKNGVEIVVKLLPAIGEPLILTELSLLSQPLPFRTDCVVSVILVMQALTLLLSSWTGSAIPTIAGQPRMLMDFLIISERIIRIWSSLKSELHDRVGVKAKWRR